MVRDLLSFLSIGLPPPTSTSALPCGGHSPRGQVASREPFARRRCRTPRGARTSFALAAPPGLVAQQPANSRRLRAGQQSRKWKWTRVSAARRALATLAGRKNRRTFCAPAAALPLLPRPPRQRLSEEPPPSPRRRRNNLFGSPASDCERASERAQSSAGSCAAKAREY